MWHVWETLEVHVGLVGKPEGKRERESMWHLWETLVVHVGLVGKPEGKREREREHVALMGDTGGACRVGGET